MILCISISFPTQCCPSNNDTTDLHQGWFCREYFHCWLTPTHDSPASFSTSRPQIIYLFVKCSIQPFMFSLEKETRSQPRQHSRNRNRKNTDISSGVRSSSLSSGWSTDVNISVSSSNQLSRPPLRGRRTRTEIK
jgi:hypothetical protein